MDMPFADDEDDDMEDATEDEEPRRPRLRLR